MTDVARVVLAKVGLDGHDVGINLVAKALVAAGFEVVYLGKRVTADQVVEATVAEDADVVGVSSLSGGLGHFAVALLERLRAAGVHAPLIAGGIDEPAEVARMLEAGVYRYVGPGTETEAVVRAFEAATDATRQETGV